jgi:hypothetical protein
MRPFLSLPASNIEAHWWNTKLNSRHFQRIWNEVWTHCPLLYYVFFWGQFHWYFECEKNLLSKEQIHFLYFVWCTLKIFLLWVLFVYDPYLDLIQSAVLLHQKPVSLFLPGSTVKGNSSWKAHRFRMKTLTTFLFWDHHYYLRDSSMYYVSYLIRRPNSKLGQILASVESPTNTPGNCICYFQKQYPAGNVIIVVMFILLSDLQELEAGLYSRTSD